MASPNDVPRVSEPIAAAGGYVTRAWVDFFLKLASSQSNEDLAALYSALAARVAELEEGQGFNFQIIGQGAISVNGTPQPGGFVVISLENDVDNPGNTMYYGTGPTGERGWFPVSGTMLVEAGQLTKTVASNGVTTFGLADVADSGTGTLLATTFDAKGRKTGSKPATITGTASQIDVANGDAAAGLPTLSLAAPVLASLAKADSAVQSVVAGTGISVDSTSPQNPEVSVSRQFGTYAGRPSVGSVPDGTVYLASDAREQYISQSGVWALVPSGGNELGYAERTSDFTVATGTTSDVPGLSVTSVVGMGDIAINFGGTMVMNFFAAGEYANLILYVDGVYTSQLLARAVGDYIVVSRTCRLSGFSPGSTHTFKLGLQSVGGTPATLAANANDRPYIQVITL